MIMGLIGRYLDSLPDRARDRVIEGQEWGMGTLVDAEGKRCLLGHAEDWTYAGSLFRNFSADPEMQRWRVGRFGPSAHLEIGRRFDTLAHRHGLAYVVRMLKLRAGRQNVPAAPDAARTRGSAA
jgi:hypothetical protein